MLSLVDIIIPNQHKAIQLISVSSAIDHAAGPTLPDPGCQTVVVTQGTDRAMIINVDGTDTHRFTRLGHLSKAIPSESQ